MCFLCVQYIALLKCLRYTKKMSQFHAGQIRVKMKIRAHYYDNFVLKGNSAKLPRALLVIFSDLSCTMILYCLFKEIWVNHECIVLQ